MLEEISLDEPCSEKFSLHVESGQSTIQNEKGDANKLCEKRKVTRLQTCISKEGWPKCNVGDMKTLRAIGKSNAINEVPSNSFLTMIKQCKQTIQKAIYIVDDQKLNTRSELMNTIPWRDANTVRGGSGGKVNKNIFLSQLNDIDEACLQQRAHGHVAKTRDRDLFRWLKQQTNASEAVPQVQPKQNRQIKCACNTSNYENLSCEMNYEIEKRKKLTKSNSGPSPNKILRWASVTSRFDAHLIGEPKISKEREMESNNVKREMTSCVTVHTGNERQSTTTNGIQNEHRNGTQDTIQKKINVCIQKLFNKNKFKIWASVYTRPLLVCLVYLHLK